MGLCMSDETKKTDAPSFPAGTEDAKGAETVEDGSARAAELDLSEADDLHSFRMKKKATRHFVAHEEYGVLFSHCGMRIRRIEVAYDPPTSGAYELICMKCLEHTKRMKASKMGKAPEPLDTK